MLCPFPSLKKVKSKNLVEPSGSASDENKDESYQGQQEHQSIISTYGPKQSQGP